MEIKLNQYVLDVAQTLRKMDHGVKADIIDDFNMESTTKINELQKEVDRLRGILEKMDRIHQHHSLQNPWGLLDSPKSLNRNIRDAINEGLKK